MKKQVWQLDNNWLFWLVSYRSTSDPSVVDKILQFKNNGRDVGHVTMHCSRATGDVIAVHYHGCFDGLDEKWWLYWSDEI